MNQIFESKRRAIYELVADIDDLALKAGENLIGHYSQDRRKSASEDDRRL